MRIDEALNGLTDQGTAVPCCHVPYLGGAETYVTFQLLGQSGQVYAEGTEAESALQFAVSVFQSRYSAALLREVKRRLQEKGFVVTVDMEHYDQDTGRNQVTLIAEIEGDAYG